MPERAAIVDAAHGLFSRQGYRGTSLASIADDVGLTLPGGCCTTSDRNMNFRSPFWASVTVAT